MMRISGGCHCGAVQFEAEVVPPLEVLRCNCSICNLTGFLHLIVADAAFQLKTDWSSLAEYTFNTRQAKHWFCQTCGVKSFYKPRSHPHGISINWNAVNERDSLPVMIREFDGRNWEASREQLPD